jgi:hypothetical protein
MLGRLRAYQTVSTIGSITHSGARIDGAREVKTEIAASSRSEIPSFDSNFTFNVQTEPDDFPVPRCYRAPNSEGVSAQPMDVLISAGFKSRLCFALAEECYFVIGHQWRR